MVIGPLNIGTGNVALPDVGGVLHAVADGNVIIFADLDGAVLLQRCYGHGGQAAVKEGIVLDGYQRDGEEQLGDRFVTGKGKAADLIGDVRKGDLVQRRHIGEGVLTDMRDAVQRDLFDQRCQMCPRRDTLGVALLQAAVIVGIIGHGLAAGLGGLHSQPSGACVKIPGNIRIFNITAGGLIIQASAGQDGTIVGVGYHLRQIRVTALVDPDAAFHVINDGRFQFAAQVERVFTDCFNAFGNDNPNQLTGFIKCTSRNGRHTLSDLNLTDAHGEIEPREIAAFAVFINLTVAGDDHLSAFLIVIVIDALAAFAGDGGGAFLLLAGGEAVLYRDVVSQGRNIHQNLGIGCCDNDRRGTGEGIRLDGTQAGRQGQAAQGGGTIEGKRQEFGCRGA